MENKYPDYIMEQVRQRLGLKKDDTSKDDLINNHMSKNEVFDSVLEWQGIIGFGYSIRSLVEDVYKVTLGED